MSEGCEPLVSRQDAPTLHGLRVSYAACRLRNGATVAEVTDLIGDLSERIEQVFHRKCLNATDV